MTLNRVTRTVTAGLALIAPALLVNLAGCAADGDAPKLAAPAGKFAFWPPAPDEPRVQFVGAFSSSEDVSKTEVSGLEKVVFGEENVKAASVNKPYGVAMRDGRIYVCDFRAKSVVVLDLAKKQTRLVGTTGMNRLERPIAIALGDNGEFFVADAVKSSILVYDKGERYVRNFQLPKFKPAALAYHAGRLYAADMGRQQVLVLDAATGKELSAIGSVGDEDGQFRLPVGVAVDAEGNVLVSDLMRCRVQKFSAEGKFIAGVGERGDHVGGFAFPKQIAVDSEGIVYVVDSAFQNVQMFNEKFELLTFFGSMGKHPGAMNMPVGVAVTDTGLDYFKDRIHPGFNARRLIVVANQFGDGKVSVYALGERRPEYSLAQMNESAAKVYEGVGKPSAEALKFQNIGGVEPGQENPEGGEGEQPAGPAKPADPKDPPAAPPASTPK